MGASGQKSQCQEASLYYYEIQDRADAAVPESVRRHIAGCAFCQGRMRSLGQMLAGGSEKEQTRRGDGGFVEAVWPHLKLADQPVTCTHVKPFLPTFLVPPQIHIPTPVTVHLDQCEPCVADLAALRGLNLTADQLHRLSRLYGVPAGGASVGCERARTGVAALGSLFCDDVPTEILDHLSTCPPCRAEVYRLRSQLASAHWRHGTGGEAASCDAVATAQLFDLVAPYGLAPAGEQVQDAQAVSAHVRACPACMGKVQGLHRTLYDIAERPDSAVTTVYEFLENAPTLPPGAEGTPTRHPVCVQTLCRAPEPIANAARFVGARPAVGGLGPRWLRRKSLWKMALVTTAAAAVVALHLVRGPAASGTDVGAILQALDRAANVHIVTRSADVPEPVQEMWIARSLNRMATRTRDHRVLYDLDAGRRRVIDTDSGEDMTDRLALEQVHRVRQMMADAVGAVLARVVRDVQLVEIPANDSTSLPAPACVVYELTVTTRAYGHSTQLQRWQIAIDPATGLPRQMESFHQEPPENNWVPVATKTFEYLSERDIMDALHALFPE